MTLYFQGVVKPDIVFFGEDLPQRFHSLQLPDFSKCDLLFIMGTSLEVISNFLMPRPSPNPYNVTTITLAIASVRIYRLHDVIPEMHDVHSGLNLYDTLYVHVRN